MVLDGLASAYMELVQKYVTAFCSVPILDYPKPEKFSNPTFTSELSARWQRVAIQQACGISQAWLTNRQNAYLAYQEAQAHYKAEQLKPMPDPKLKEPKWREGNIPYIRATCIQANVNVVIALTPADEPVVKLELAKPGQFDYWLRVATLEKGKPLYLPVKLAKYHKQKLEGHLPNSSVSLNKRQDGSWWLTLTITETVTTPAPTQTKIGCDVGIVNFLTASTGKQYGTFHGKLATRHKADREKRRRKAKLIACLKKKGLPKEKLPAVSTRQGQRLSHHTKHSINRAVNQFVADHKSETIVYEDLSVATMRFKARAMNAYLYASQLGHIPKQIQWVCAKRGSAAITVNPAYSSQQCPVCHLAHRDNRKRQETFSCTACGYTALADFNAATNLKARADDTELLMCKDKTEVKNLLNARHQSWLENSAARSAVARLVSEPSSFNGRRNALN
jgi:IS605 OrfB family transposase